MLLTLDSGIVSKTFCHASLHVMILFAIGHVPGA